MQPVVKELELELDILSILSWETVAGGFVIQATSLQLLELNLAIYSPVQVRCSESSDNCSADCSATVEVQTSQCNVPCGNGTQTVATVVTEIIPAAHGGQECMESSTLEQACYMEPCVYTDEGEIQMF